MVVTRDVDMIKKRIQFCYRIAIHICSYTQGLVIIRYAFRDLEPVDYYKEIIRIR